MGHPVAREDIGLAVNSVFGRTQNQLHVHIDCVRPVVRQIIEAHSADIGARWSQLDVGVHGHRYRVRWLRDADLAAHDPFKLLAHSDPVARADMGRETLVLIGASRPNGAPGFVLLADRTSDDHKNTAAGEELLDHQCAVLSQPAVSSAASVQTPGD